MISSLYYTLLYQPLFNLLIFLYEFDDNYNFGLAVIFLTVIIRFVLLPFSFFAQRNKAHYEALSKEVKKIQEDLKYDPEQSKIEVRKALKKHKIRPWAKAIILGVQGLILVVFYKVFMGMIRGDFTSLYPFMTEPDFVNTIFLGIDLKERNFYLASFVGIILFLEIWYNQRKITNILTPSDIAFRYFFPLSSIIVLAVLPAVKSIFILTSIFFTIIVSIVLKIFVKPVKVKK